MLLYELLALKFFTTNCLRYHFFGTLTTMKSIDDIMIRSEINVPESIHHVRLIAMPPSARVIYCQTDQNSRVNTTLIRALIQLIYILVRKLSCWQSMEVSEIDDELNLLQQANTQSVFPRLEWAFGRNRISQQTVKITRMCPVNF